MHLHIARRSYTTQHINPSHEVGVFFLSQFSQAKVLISQFDLPSDVDVKPIDWSQLVLMFLPYSPSDYNISILPTDRKKQ